MYDANDYGSHYDTEAGNALLKGNARRLDVYSLHWRFEWLPPHERESWATMAANGFLFYACMVNKETGEIERWVSRSKRFQNFWKNQNNPRFPWEIFIFIKIK